MASLTPGSLIFVSACNSYIAAHIVDHLLAAGYRVRGSVRSISRCQWMLDHFNSIYPGHRFSLVEITTITAPDAYDAALEGAAGFVHAAFHTNVAIPDVPAMLADTEAGVRSALDAAHRAGTVKSLVFLGSCFAMYTPPGTESTRLDERSWNEAVVKLSLDESVPAEQKGLAPYMAGKVRAEQAFWEWVLKHDPGFSFCTVPTSTVIGPVLSPEAQGFPSTAGYIRQTFRGENLSVVSQIPPQWYVDVRDVARLHVAALTDPSAHRRRVMAFAGKLNLTEIMAAFREKIPDKNFDWLKGDAHDLTDVDASLAKELLRSVGRDGFLAPKESLHDAIAQY